MAAITYQGERLIARKQGDGQVLKIDRIVLANIPDLDPAKPVDRHEKLPAAGQIVLNEKVSQHGHINPNLVVYSLMMATGGNDFEFNWLGLYASADDVVVAITYLPLQRKSKSVAMTRNFMLEFSGAAETTDINIDAKSWQVDFSARMIGTDNRARQMTQDVFGRQLFYGDACKVVHKSGDTYEVLPGTGYVAGIRFDYPGKTIRIAEKPTAVWLDLSQQGNSMSDIQPVVEVVVSDEKQSDRIDAGGIQHYLEKIAEIESLVVDTRIVQLKPIVTPARNEAQINATTLISRLDLTGYTHLKTAGFDTAADGGGAEFYKKLHPETDKIGDRIDAAGNRFGLVINGFVHASWLGVIGDGRVSTSELNSALRLGAGKTVILPDGIISATDTITIPSNTTVIGEGSGRWLFTQPWVPKTTAGTELRFVGNGPKRHTVKYVTDCRTAGGVVKNPSPVDDKDTHYKLTTFTNNNGTLRKFSIGVALEGAARNVHLKGFRIVPNFKGIDGYNDESTTELGDEWDVGLLVGNSDHCTFEDIQVVGYWRILGKLQLSVNDNNEDNSAYAGAGSEYVTYLRCMFQGMTGAAIRGADLYKVTGVTGNYIEIENGGNEHFETHGSVRTGSTNPYRLETYQYTEKTVVSGKLRLLMPSTSGINVGDLLCPAIYSNGISNTVYRDCEITGLDHSSRKRVTELGFDKPSACFEASGWTLRGCVFDNTKVTSHDDVAYHLHAILDFEFLNQTVIESKADVTSGKLGIRCIASPSESDNTRVSHPAGSSANLSIEYGSTTNGGFDMRPVTNLIPDRFSNGGGLFEPNRVRYLDYVFPKDSKNAYVRAPAHGRAGIKDSDGIPRITVYESGKRVDINPDEECTLRTGNNYRIHLGGVNNQYLSENAHFFYDYAKNLRLRLSSKTGELRPGGHIKPMADAAYDLGTLAYRFKTVYAESGSIETSDANLKQDIKPIDPSLKNATKQIAFKLYRLKSAVSEKGEGARYHAGVIAQDVHDVFVKNGVDPFKYGVLCKEEVVLMDPETEEETHTGEERWSVRYNELYALILSSLIEAVFD